MNLFITLGLIIILASIPQFYGAIKRREAWQFKRLLVIPSILLAIGIVLFLIGLSKVAGI